MTVEADWLRRPVLAALFAFLLIAPALADSAPQSNKVVDFSLDNGMEVVVIPDHRAPIVTHMVWYKVGSADEPPGKSGIAHFFEHLMFKGTTNHKAGEFDAAIAAIGGSNNAFTSYDFTAYYETVTPEALGEMMRFEADRMRNLVLSEEVVATERDVILEERRSRIDNSPNALLREEVDATLYQNQPYRIPVIGWKHEMEKLNRTDAQAFYDRYYTPNNAVLVVAGDVDPQTVRQLAGQTYGRLERGPELPPRVRPTEPEQNTKRTVTLGDPRVSVPSFSTQWVVPSYTTAKDGEAEALDLLAEILGGGSRSRLYQALVVKQGIASGVGASFQGAMLDDSSFSVYATPRGDAKLADVEAAVNAEVARIVAEGVALDELEKAKTRLVRSMVFARDRQAAMANIYGTTLATGGTVRDVEAWPGRIRAVTAGQIKSVAARYLDMDRATTGYLLPDLRAEN